MVWRLGFSAMAAFAFSCPLSLHYVFCAIAQLLGLVFPSLPVFASGGWEERKGGEDGICFKVVHPSGLLIPTTLKQTVECLVTLRV